MKKVIGIIMVLCIGSWILCGFKIKYGDIRKESFGYSQEIYYSIWGRRVNVVVKR
jgi:hypothetical protein